MAYRASDARISACATSYSRKRRVPSKTVHEPEIPALYESELPDSMTPVASFSTLALRSELEPLALTVGRKAAHELRLVR